MLLSHVTMNCRAWMQRSYLTFRSVYASPSIEFSNALYPHGFGALRPFCKGKELSNFPFSSPIAATNFQVTSPFCCSSELERSDIAGRRFAVLVTGHASDYTQRAYGGYGKMLARLLGDPGEMWDIFPVVEGKFPPEAELGKYEGFVLTGSRHDAHANEEWILKLCSVVRSLHEKRTKMLGICFGHQVLCRALGGKTGKAAVGWEIGLKDITLTDAIALKSYGFGLPRVLKIFQTHQDQVLELPPGGELLGSSEKTGIELFAIGDHVLGIQGHPEYTKDVLLDVIESRRSFGIIKEVEANMAKASMLEGEDDKEIIRNLCKSFLKRR